MNLRPDLKRPMLTAWGIFGGVVLVCALVAWWLADAGALPSQVERSTADLNKLSGDVDLAKRKEEQRNANATLMASIETLKKNTGMVVTAPFLVPAGTPQPGQYFNEQLAAVQDYLRPKAKDRSIGYQEKLGFENTSKVPDDKDAPYLLTMLQLTRKAADIILSTPTPVMNFKIEQPLKQPELNRSAGRDPLLLEYPLRLSVRGSLSDLLWILHALAQNTGNGDYPLIVRKWTIDSKNIKPSDEIQQLDAVFEVAAMKFLSPTERVEAGKTLSRTSGRGL